MTLIGDVVFGIGLLAGGAALAGRCPNDPMTGDRMLDGCTSGYIGVTAMVLGFVEFLPLGFTQKRTWWTERGDRPCPDGPPVPVKEVQVIVPGGEVRTFHRGGKGFSVRVPLADASDIRIVAGGANFAATAAFKELADVTRARLPRLEVQATLTDPNGDGALEARETAQLLVKVMNRGTGAAYLSIGAETAARGVEIGAASETVRLAPGAEHDFTMSVRATASVPDADEALFVVVHEARGFGGEPVRVALHTERERLPRIVLAGLDVDDSSEGDGNGDGDGKLMPGEIASVVISFQNVGEGRTDDPVVVLTSTVPDDVHVARRDRGLGVMQAGEVAGAAFVITVAPRYRKKGPLPITVEVSDSLHGPLLKTPLPLELGREAPPPTYQARPK